MWKNKLRLAEGVSPKRALSNRLYVCADLYMYYKHDDKLADGKFCMADFKCALL